MEVHRGLALGVGIVGAGVCSLGRGEKLINTIVVIRTFSPWAFPPLGQFFAYSMTPCWPELTSTWKCSMIPAWADRSFTWGLARALTIHSTALQL